MRKIFSFEIRSYVFIFSLDPELKDELILIITKLLADKTIVSKEERKNDLMVNIFLI
jgi:hypothetical protein